LGIVLAVSSWSATLGVSGSSLATRPTSVAPWAARPGSSAGGLRPAYHAGFHAVVLILQRPRLIDRLSIRFPLGRRSDLVQLFEVEAARHAVRQ